MRHRNRIPVISPNLDDLLIFFLILLLIPSIIIAHFTSFNSFLVYILLIISFLSVFILSYLVIEKVKPSEIKKIGSKYVVSGLSLLLIILLIPAALITNLIHLPFVFVYVLLAIVFFIVLAYLVIKKIIIHAESV